MKPEICGVGLPRAIAVRRCADGLCNSHCLREELPACWSLCVDARLDLGVVSLGSKGEENHATKVLFWPSTGSASLSSIFQVCGRNGKITPQEIMSQECEVLHVIADGRVGEGSRLPVTPGIASPSREYAVKSRCGESTSKLRLSLAQVHAYLTTSATEQHVNDIRTAQRNIHMIHTMRIA